MTYLIVIIAWCQYDDVGGARVGLNVAFYTFQGINLLFVYRYIKHSFSLRLISVSDCPFNFSLFGYRFGDLEPDTRSRIDMRDHRSKEDQKPIKAFYLDLMLDARNNGETGREKALTTDYYRNKFDQIAKYELNSVDPPVLKKFVELLNEEKREEFMKLAKPKST